MNPAYYKTTFRLAGLTKKARRDLLGDLRRYGMAYTVEWDGKDYLVVFKVLENYSK